MFLRRFRLPPEIYEVPGLYVTRTLLHPSPGNGLRMNSLRPTNPRKRSPGQYAPDHGTGGRTSEDDEDDPTSRPETNVNSIWQLTPVVASKKRLPPHRSSRMSHSASSIVTVFGCIA